LTRERSTFTRRDVVMAFAEAAAAGAMVSEIEARADAFLARDQVVELEPVAGERRYTTRGLLAVERDLLDGSGRRLAARVGIAGEAEVEAALAARPSLSAEQRTLVRTLACSGDGVQVVRAAAGTGKTMALDGARDAWQHSRLPVLGCALSARAACELRDGAGIDATTIARLTYGLERGVELAPGAVLVVDEAGMVGTRDLARLARAVEQAGGKLVLLGDDRQLSEIDAGGAFHALADRLGAVELQEVHRQREGWDRDALAALRNGDVERFVREYQAHGRIVAATTADQAKQALVDDWWRSHQHGERALMIAHRRSDVAELNRRARERMRQDGRLGPDKLATAERSFAEGDRVVTTRNDRRLDVVNGQTGTIKTIRAGRVEVDLDRGTRTALPEHYAREHLDHAYATTAHRAQGATVERSFVLGSDELYREWGYTALSRHRQEARFYVTASPRFINQRPDPLRTTDDVSKRVRLMLSASRAEQLASDTAHEPAEHSHDHRLDDARAQLAETETRLEALQGQRDDTRWYQRGARAEIDQKAAGWQRAREHWRDQTDRLADEAAARPQRHEPQLERAHDPLAQLDPAREIQRELTRARERPGHDMGRDLGW
jgi:Ti-type conjugative transfer relaxase TraA